MLRIDDLADVAGVALAEVGTDLVVEGVQLRAERVDLALVRWAPG